MNTPNTYYLSLAKLQAINTQVFLIYREMVAGSNYDTHHEYFKDADLVEEHVQSMRLEKTIVIKAAHGDIDAEIKAVREAIKSTQGIINTLKLICPDSQLDTLTKLDFHLLLILRDMHHDAKKQTALAAALKPILEVHIA